MSDNQSDNESEASLPTFRPFTREELAIIENRILEKSLAAKKKAEKRAKNIAEFGDSARARKLYADDDDDEDEEELEPNPKLGAGNDLPRRYGEFPLEFASTPICDIDPYYADKKTFIVISKGGTIFRFSAEKALYLLSPFHPIRRIAIHVLTHPLFSFAIICTILVNCYVMVEPDTEYTASTEVVFTAIYTYESAVKLLSRGFALEGFTYLRDAWNWLDFSVIGMSYVTIAVDLGSFSALRTFRVFRALKSVAVIPGLKTIVSAIVYSVKNLRDVIILTLFALAVFALLGLQVYMGVLSQKCVRNYPTDPEELEKWGNLTDESWDFFMHNDTNWWVDEDLNYGMCGNASGAGKCPDDYTCMDGFGPNPNYGYTSFDSFITAYLCAFRLMTQDYWENLYQITLMTAGPMHILFFIFNIFLGSFYLINLILAIVAMSYDELQRQAEEEAARELEELEAIKEAEEAALAEAEAAAAEAAAEAAAGLFGDEDDDEDEEDCEKGDEGRGGGSEIHSRSGLPSPGRDSTTFANKYPSRTLPAHSYEQVDRSEEVETTTDRMSIRSATLSLYKSEESLDQRANGKSLPASPFIRRPSKSNSFHSHVRLPEKYDSRKPLVLFTYLDAQEHLPYADDSTAVTPKSEMNGGIIVDTPTKMGLSRKYSYNSHTGKESYTSHTDVRYPNTTKTGTLVNRMALMFSDMENNKPSTPNSAYTLEPITHQYDINRKPSLFMNNGGKESLDIKDVMVLNDIIDQVSERPQSKATHLSSAYQDDDDEGPKVKDIVFDCIKKTSDVMCVWDCCWLWIRTAEVLSIIVFDPFTELFITLCIMVNVLFMSMDHYDVEYDGMSPFFNSMLTNGNYFFTAIFAVESFVKLFAMSPRYFFADGWNCFDFLIVALSLVELLAEGVSGLSMLRSFRLLRVFKLAKSWKSLNDILTIMMNTVGALSNLTFVLCIIIFIFAVMGMQLFGKDYMSNVCHWDGCAMPRWNFTDFMHSFMIVFRVLCGEWIESMWDCIFVSGKACIPYFMATVLVGNLVILNLFLALLLSSFSDMGGGGDEDDEPDKMAIAFGRFGTFKRFLIRSIKNFFVFLKNKIVELVTGRRTDYDEEMLGEGEEKGYQGENGDLKNRGMDVKINHIDIPMGDLDKNESTYADSSIGEGMDITIQGANGHLKQQEKDNISIVSRESAWRQINKENLLLPDMDKNKLRYADSSIGEGMDITIQGEGGHPGLKESCTDSIHSGDSGWRRSKNRKNGSIGGSTEKIEFDDGKVEDEMTGYNEEVKQVEEVLYDPVDEVVVEECCPPVCYRVCPCCIGDAESPFWQLWYKHRLQISRLIEDKYFETVVLCLILLSSFVMTLEDVWFETKPLLVDSLYYLDRILTVVFFLETCLKLLAMGVVAYFGNAWCWLDFVIVSVSLINFAASLLGAGNIPIFKTMRTLRALRPLRAMAKMEGMKVVVNALVGALPSIFNVLTVCIIFWLIFAIIGVNTFMGKFQECVNEDDAERFNHEIIPNKTVCLNETGALWVNPRITFDNVPMAYLALFQVATFKGWIDIMDDAIDMVTLNEQPHRENSIYMYFYFVFFIVFGSFFTLNLLVGVIIDKFNEQKNKGGSSLDAFMTEDQKKYIAAMKKAGGKKPVKALPRPNWGPQAIIFGIITNKKFDMIVMGFIGLNMVCMMCDHWRQSAEWTFALDNLNLGFIVIFTAEMFMKMFALRHHYFAEPWNLFDFVVVLLSLAGLFLSDLIEKYFVSPTLLRVVRVAKVGRVLRLIKGAKGIRTLLFSLIMSMPALLNICLLLFLVMFIFAVFGMSLFKNVQIRGGFNDVHNFKTFFKTFILLFQMATSAGWDGTLNAIFDDTDCKLPDTEIGETGDCGKFAAGVAYMIAYLTLSFLIIVNMYIAVILENYSQATEDVQEGITDEDYDLFYEIWQEFDPDGTQYIDYKGLSEFLDVLEPPLQIPRPNKFKIIHMDIPIVKWTNPENGEIMEDKVFCSDILDALTQDFFARKGNPIEEPPHVEEIKVTTFADRPGYERTSSSLWKQREEYCASLIQKAWKVHKNRATGATMSKAEEPVTSDDEQHSRHLAHN